MKATIYDLKSLGTKIFFLIENFTHFGANKTKFFFNETLIQFFVENIPDKFRYIFQINIFLHKKNPELNEK